MKPLPSPKFLKSKFSRTNFFRSLLRLFLRPKFLRPIPRLFFETKSFRDRYRDFFSRPNLFETDTDTFFRDQIFSRPIPRLFFETKYFRDWYRNFFWDQNFRDWYRDFLLDQNFWDQYRDFVWDQIFLRLILRLIYETMATFYETETETFFSKPDISILRHPDPPSAEFWERFFLEHFLVPTQSQRLQTISDAPLQNEEHTSIWGFSCESFVLKRSIWGFDKIFQAKKEKVIGTFCLT